MMVDGLGVGPFLRSVAQQTWAQPKPGSVVSWMVRDSQLMEGGPDHPGFSIVEGNQVWVHQPLPPSRLREKYQHHGFKVLQELESDWSPPSHWGGNETLILESISWQVLRRLRLLSTPEVLQEDCVLDVAGLRLPIAAPLPLGHGDTKILAQSLRSNASVTEALA
eukprot:s4422_g1.t1